jgi:rhamnose utilization protein RhaD (predicted bifunctional aldolase and dehydrogenase)/NAD(P)-dependent dehydrogenase (short-subunit alcohol dehydrogenase family)
VKSLWNETDAKTCEGDPLKLRVYTSRLLGREPTLVLHGGGNTSVKASATNLFGDKEELLYIKGSGWDLATIEAAGFAPVKLGVLKRMAELSRLTDTDMVRAQRAAMTDASAPTPSVEAILHAIIPATFVDHTHADAVVAISNTPGGDGRIQEIYPDRMLVVPYVMPGFILARKIYEMTRGIAWSRYDGMVLLHHGIFSWGDDARTSYERMIGFVTRAEEYLQRKKALTVVRRVTSSTATGGHGIELSLARLRRAASLARGAPMIAELDDSAEAAGFASTPDVQSIATRGPLTPDHVIRTKPRPVVLDGDCAVAVEEFASAYRDYFQRNARPGLTSLDPAPRWAVWPGVGTVALGGSAKDASITSDIVRHTVRAIQWAEALGGWRALPENDLFDVEYWDLEQAKLRQGGTNPQFHGKIALVTGAASGIGRACAEMLSAQGAAVTGLDVNPEVTRLLAKPGQLGLTCDVTDPAALREAVETAVRRFGGIDILVSNAGIFSPSERLEEMTEKNWQRSLALNLTSHQVLLQLVVPYLRLGFDAAIVINASKNVPAPGPAAGAYSVAKAGLTQLARVAALELAADGIRVNVLHPHAVFDTAAWTPEVLQARARHYGMTVEEYKRNNLLGVEVRSMDVAALACAMAGAPFAKTTGAQVPIDGGSDRVI